MLEILEELQSNCCCSKAKDYDVRSAHRQVAKHSASHLSRVRNHSAYISFAWIIGASAASLLFASLAQAQDLLATPKLRVVGPENQYAYSIIRYYDANICSKVVRSKIQLTGSDFEQPLEFGHEGVLILIASTTRQPITATLSDEEVVLQQATTRKPGEMVEVKHGIVPEGEQFSVPRVVPNEEERGLVLEYLKALHSQNSKSLVSTLPDVNIQWQTLDAFAAVCNEHLGKHAAVESPETLNLDGWLSLPGNLGSRVLSGPLSFENGVCNQTIVVIDGRLVDVQFESKAIPYDWFDGPRPVDAFARRGLELAQLIFSANDRSQEAQRAFAKRLHQSITVEKLQEFRKKMRGEYGDAIETAELIKTSLAPFEVGQNFRSLDVFHKLKMSGGQECICQTRFSFTTGRQSNSTFHRVGLGQLVAITVRPTWPSAAPKQAEAVAEFIAQFADGQTSLDLFHPSFLEHADTDALTRELKSVAVELKPSAIGELLETWSADQNGQHAFAAGNIETEKGRLEVRFDFLEDKILNVEMVGSYVSWQSGVHLREAQDLAYRAQNFWNRLFKGDLPDAHRVLAEDFQMQLPLNKFEDLVERSELLVDRKLKQVVWDQTRLATRLDRKLPLTVSTYHVAEFKNGSFQPVRCEFRWNEKDWELIDFTTDFSIRLPAKNFERIQNLVSEMNAESEKAVISMLAERFRPSAEPIILSAFLSELKSQIGNYQLGDRIKRIEEYSPGNRIEIYSAQLENSEEPRRITAAFQNDSLLSINVYGADLSMFIDEISDPNWFADYASSLCEDWLKGEREDLRRLLISNRDELNWDRIESLRSGWLLTLGDFQKVLKSQQIPVPGTNRKRCVVELQFSDGTAKVEITFVVDAFSARIADLRSIAD